jgi:OmpA-OmpF porin, OOP family
MKSVTTHTVKPAQICLLAAALIGCPLAMAAEPGWYAGVSLGESQTKIEEERITNTLLARGFTSARLQKKDDQAGFKVFSGYQFNQYVAIEGGYFDLGQFSYTAYMQPWAVTTADAKMRGLNLDLVGFLPMSEKLSAFGRAGLTQTRTKSRFRGYGPVSIDPFNANDNDTSWKYGVGLQYDVTNNLAMRLEAERYRFDDVIGNDEDIDMFSLGVVYRFAAAPAAAPVQASAPAPAPRPAAAPAPTPAPAPVPAPVRVTFSADSLFDFDSSVVRTAGQAELDKLAADLRGVDFDTIVVTGHTDRIGAQAYNLKLSTERAEAVKAYLVRSANISAAQVTTRGVNGAEPITTAAQCGPQLTRAQLIPCLAADRRVEVEVTGTRPR